MLDMLLHDHHDAMVSVLGNFDAKMLLQLERVSKSFQKNIRAKGVLRTGVLNSFPGITNVPEVTDYEVYAHILRYHYRNDIGCAGCWDDYMSICKQYCLGHLASLGDEGERLINSLEFDAIIADFYQRRSAVFQTLRKRQVLLQYIGKWKASWTSRPIEHKLANIDHYRSTKSVIDRILAIASSNFCFYSSGEEKKLFPYGIICTNEELIPEVRRHRDAEAEFLKNPTCQSPMNYILSRMQEVSDELHYLDYDEEDDDDDDDEEEEDHGKVEEDHGEADEDHGKVEEDHGEVDEDHGEVEEDHGEVEEDQGSPAMTAPTTRFRPFK